jgi:hypothetical protein
MATKDMPHGIVGFRFAQALLKCEFSQAREMLSPELKLEYSAFNLKERFEDMMSIADPAFSDAVAVDNARHPELDEKGWAYVAISTEAVTVTVKPFEQEYLITELIWGRP